MKASLQVTFKQCNDNSLTSYKKKSKLEAEVHKMINIVSAFILSSADLEHNQAHRQRFISLPLGVLTEHQQGPLTKDCTYYALFETPN